ncbi:hypothetical protein [Weissella cibaria]|uniref:hypothetical protein n=1 Tax=Weissella cibaria TaxID=137591 RepID=UPI001192C4E5|nr:hypothetical protein [Weissella cibaria]TVV31842.1 hypothetical protein FO434_06175 [Weissella cibaria]
MSKHFKIITAVLIVVVLAIGGGVWYGVSHNPKNLTAEQFAQLPIEEQFDKAPEGHYIHLGKNDSTLYRTTWSQNKIKKYLTNDFVKTDTNSDGTSPDKSKMGTNHKFDDTILMNSAEGYGEIGQIYHNLFSNHKFNPNFEETSDDTYEWYFDDLKSAKADKDVSGYVTKIVR